MKRASSFRLNQLLSCHKKDDDHLPDDQLSGYVIVQVYFFHVSRAVPCSRLSVYIRFYYEHRDAKPSLF